MTFQSRFPSSTPVHSMLEIHWRGKVIFIWIFFSLFFFPSFLSLSLHLFFFTMFFSHNYFLQFYVSLCIWHFIAFNIWLMMFSIFVSFVFFSLDIKKSFIFFFLFILFISNEIAITKLPWLQLKFHLHHLELCLQWDLLFTARPDMLHLWWMRTHYMATTTMTVINLIFDQCQFGYVFSL